MHDEPLRFVLLITMAVFIFLPSCQADRIKMFVTGHIGIIESMHRFFRGEPLVEYVAVPARDDGVSRMDDMLRFIRLYFPRTYEQMKTFDFIMLASPEYNLFTPKQDEWIYNVIREGAGGVNDGSVFSVVSQIHTAWANSLAQRAFPNDAPAVSARGGGESVSYSFSLTINRDYPDPVLTPFVPFGVEKAYCYAASRLVIPREGSGTLAYQTGNFLQGTVAYLIAWDYEKGRTMTCGDFMGNGWLSYPTWPSANQYSPDILVNMLLYCTKRKLIEDVEAFHRVKSSLAEFRSRMAVLVSLKDFIDKFGANTQGIQNEMQRLESMYAEAAAYYMESDFAASDEAIRSALAEFPRAEEVARKEKDAALFWVYVVEWLMTSSTLFVSGFVLWTLMVRRRLYRAVEATRLG